ncbi:MAG: hypothetical protein ACK4NY_08075 [Spirosomataceae bacterium]
MIRIENIDEIDIGTLGEYRNKMSELIFTSKKFDGQPNKEKRDYLKISKEIQDLELKFNHKLKKYINEAERFNTHPKNIKVDGIYGYLDFGNFNTIPSKPIFQDIYFTDDPLPLRGIANSGRYIEPHIINRLIKKWFEVNKKSMPQNIRKVDFYFDFEFLSSIINSQWNLLINNRIDEIQFLDCCKIYIHQKNNRTDKNRLKRSKHNLVKFSKYYYPRLNLLSEEQHFNDRGHILIDYQRLSKVNGKTVFEFYSTFFWDFFDALFELHKNSPEVFGNGAELLINELFKFMNTIERIKELPFMKNIKEFKLKLQQNYAYFGDTEKGLRIDLFRNIVPDKNKPDIPTFEGGLLHVLRHFENDGVPISATFEGGHQFYESYFMDTLKEAFFVSELKEVIDKKGKKSIISEVESIVEKNKIYKFVFFKNPHADGLYSINTMYLEDKK